LAGVWFEMPVADWSSTGNEEANAESCRAGSMGMRVGSTALLGSSMTVGDPACKERFEKGNKKSGVCSGKRSTMVVGSETQISETWVSAWKTVEPQSPLDAARPFTLAL
jgi:hypothetical protein